MDHLKNFNMFFSTNILDNPNFTALKVSWIYPIDLPGFVVIRSKKSTGQLGSTILVESVLILNRQVFLASFWTQICAGFVLLKLETAVNS